MTSTNVFNGLADRNSSRVLRPPGGGQTDVLGVRSGPEEPQPKIASPKKTVVVAEAPRPKGVTPTVNECISKPKVEPKSATTNSNEAPARARVPPGGFSSGGFW